MKLTVPMEYAADLDEYVINLPPDMLFFMDWRPGDCLSYDFTNGQVTVRNLDAEARDQSRQSLILENTK